MANRLRETGSRYPWAKEYPEHENGSRYQWAKEYRSHETELPCQWPTETENLHANESQ
jgi:hypothetical protein